MTHLTLKCEQLFVKLKSVYALKLDTIDGYKAQLDNALFTRPVLHVNLYNDDKLSFTSNAYCSIKSNAFQNFHKINSLSMILSKISKLEANSFEELSQLKELKLICNSNSLVINTNALNCLTNLELLSISADSQYKGPGMLKGLLNLKYIQFNRISMSSISDHFFCNAQKLEKITLNSNNLNSISIYGLQGLTKLQSVYIIYNEIKTINLQSFANLPCLKEVSLYGNGIQRIKNKRRYGMPQDGDFFPKLETIDLSWNRITHFMPDTFIIIQFGHLIRLNLSQNKLTQIPVSTLRGLHQLRTLNLSSNQIEKIEAGSFDELSKLKEIYLSHNKLAKLDASLFCKLCHLEALEVEGNKLDKKCVDRLLNLKFQYTRQSLQFEE